VNADWSAGCEPDALVDLESFPWPWPDNAAEQVLLNHVLEHLGAAPAVYIGIMKELWRVCRPGATVTIAVPHPRSDDFLNDPTHVRPVTAEGLVLFSRKANEYWARQGSSNTPLALQHGIDFDFVSVDTLLEEPWASDRTSGKLDERGLDEAVLRYNNVIKQQTFVLRAVK
jgi:hypothetical protein